MKRQKREVLRRRREAQARQAERDKLSPQEQIAKLDKVLGKGKGAKKERRKLIK